MLLWLLLVLTVTPPECEQLSFEAASAFAAAKGPIAGVSPQKLRKGWVLQCAGFSQQTLACAVGKDRDKDLARMLKQLSAEKLPAVEIQERLSTARKAWSILDCPEVGAAFERAAREAGAVNDINVELELGEQKTIIVPGIQRVAVSGSVVDVKTIGNNELLLIGSILGKSTALIWTANGNRISLNSHVVEAHAKTPARVPITSHRESGGVTVVEIPEGLHDVREERSADGGSVLVGINDKGLKVFITIEERGRPPSK